MALIEFKNLPDTTTPINAGNLNNNFNELNEKMGYISSLYDGEITGKGVFDLKSNVDLFDFILVVATKNIYGHYRMCTILKENLLSDLFQYIQYEPTLYTPIKVWSDKIDTSSSAVGDDNTKITGIYGIKL